MLGSIAEFENDLRKDRQADGIAMAIRKGVKFGHKKALADGQVLEFRQTRSEGLKVRELRRTSTLASRLSIVRWGKLALVAESKRLCSLE